MFEAAPPIPLNSGLGGDCLEVKGCLPPADGLGALGDHWSRTHLSGVITQPYPADTLNEPSIRAWHVPLWMGTYLPAQVEWGLGPEVLASTSWLSRIRRPSSVAAANRRGMRCRLGSSSGGGRGRARSGHLQGCKYRRKESPAPSV